MLDSQVDFRGVPQSVAAGIRSSLSLHDAEKLRRSLCHFARCRLRSRADAEDAAQETLLRFLSMSHDPPKPDQQMAYLLGIARHVICDMCNGHSREILVKPDRCERWVPTEDRVPADPLTGLIARERADAVQDAMDRLPENQKDVVEACVIGDSTCADVAREMGAPPARLRQRKSRALRRLRRDLLAAL